MPEDKKKKREDRTGLEEKLKETNLQSNAIL